MPVPPRPFNFNGLVRHYYLRERPHMGDVQILLTPKHDRERSSHELALEIRQMINQIDVPAGTSLKTVEPPPGPPVMATPAGRGLWPHPRGAP